MFSAFPWKKRTVPLRAGGEGSNRGVRPRPGGKKISSIDPREVRRSGELRAGWKTGRTLPGPGEQPRGGETERILETAETVQEVHATDYLMRGDEILPDSGRLGIALVPAAAVVLR